MSAKKRRGSKSGQSKTYTSKTKGARRGGTKGRAAKDATTKGATAKSTGKKAGSTKDRSTKSGAAESRGGTNSSKTTERTLRHEVALDHVSGEEYLAPALEELTSKSTEHSAARQVVDLSSAGRLVCPACGNRVKTVLGSERRWHFALADSEGGECDHEPESVEHRATKMALYAHLETVLTPKGWSVYCEKTLENGRRPDILLTYPGTGPAGSGGLRVAVEVQYADISQKTLKQRRSNYAALGVADLWLMGHTRRGLGRDLLARTLAESVDQRVIYVSENRVVEILPSYPPQGMDRPEGGWSYRTKRKTRKCEYALRRASVTTDDEHTTGATRPKARWHSPADSIFEQILLRDAARRNSNVPECDGRKSKASVEPASKRWARIRELTREHERLMAGGLCGTAEVAALGTRLDRARAEDGLAAGYDPQEICRELSGEASPGLDSSHPTLQRLAEVVTETTGADRAIYCAPVRWKLALAKRLLKPGAATGELTLARDGVDRFVREVLAAYPHDRTKGLWAAEAFLGRLRRSL